MRCEFCHRDIGHDRRFDCDLMRVISSPPTIFAVGALWGIGWYRLLQG